MSVDQTMQTLQTEFNKIVEHLKTEFGRLQIGRANSSLVENISVDMYGTAQPIKALASISIPDPRTLQIQPWDRSGLAAIEKAIVGAGLGLNPVNDGICVRISIPPLTEERRADLTKVARKLAEDARISVRNARQDANNQFKQMKAAVEITEDDLHDGEKKLQAKVDAVNEQIEQLLSVKEKEIMTV